MALKVTRSSGNIFRDLGFPKDEAEHLRVRADLLIQIQKELKARKVKQAEEAKVLGVTQPRVSDLVRGRIDLFSVDGLIDMLARLGVRVRVVTTHSRKRLRVA
jgi:predicted XRE-type DNA-binding protein